MSPAPPPIPAPPANGSFRLYPSYKGYSGELGAPVPFLLPPAYGKLPGEIEVPLLFTGTEGSLSTTCGNADFSLAFKRTGKGKEPVTQANVTTVLTTAAAIWAAALAARVTLRANFVGFLEEVEKLEGSVLIPGAARRIAVVLTEAIPAPPVETLFFRYGLSPGLEPGTLPYVDLVPGMRLRIEAQASQYLNPESKENAYLPAGSLLADVGTAAAAGSPRPIAFDSFLATIRSPTVSGSNATPVPAGGRVDLSPTGGARTHWRLVAPQQVGSPTEEGALTIAGSFTLVGANSLAALEAAIKSYPKPPGNGEQLYVAFDGRALVVPEIPIWLSFPAHGLTTMEYVPLGTTLANAVERFTSLPLDPEANPLSASRLMSTGSPRNVTPYTDGQTPALTPELFDVPLAAGDTVTLKTI